MAILVDLSQVVFGACYAFKDDLNPEKTKQNKQEAVNLIRHVILSQLKYYNVKYRQQYGKLIISCDGGHYWRRTIFPYYKANRKKAREKQDIDWDLVFQVFNEMIKDLREYFMFKVVQVDQAESDDVIAILSKYFQTNEIQDDIMFSIKQPIIIISSDKDFIQLQKYDNVKQISPRNKMDVTDPDPNRYLQEKIANGDRGDGICNILSPDNTFVDGLRSNKLTSKKLNQLLEEGYDNCKDQTIKRNWKRNKVLIDFDYIPKSIESKIIEEYQKPIQGNKAKAFNYLIQHNCNLLVKDIEDFVP